MALFASKEAAPAEKKRRPAVIEPPLTVIIGFSQTGSARDAEGVAKSYINKNFAADISWYAVAPFSGGYLHEVHQGGNGISYLPEVLEVLNANTTSGIARIPSGTRVMEVSMRDGRPVPLLLSESDSRQFLSHSENFPLPSGKMNEAVKSGLLWVHAGIVGMVVGSVLLFGSIGYYFMSTSNEVLSKQTPPEQLPHRQWETVRRLRTDQYVSRLKFENNRWSVDFADSPADPARSVVRAPVQPIPSTAPAPPAPPSPPAEPPHTQAPSAPNGQITAVPAAPLPLGSPAATPRPSFPASSIAVIKQLGRPMGSTPPSTASATPAGAPGPILAPTPQPSEPKKP
ncbi:hypothetical protein ACVIGB_000399 [Bradyrhizobium sp. USDA 4341]